MGFLIKRSDFQIRNIETVFLVEFLPHNIGNLIATVASLLAASVSKTTTERLWSRCEN